MRVPRVVLDFLLRQGFQDATPEGEEPVWRGVELSEMGGRCYVRVHSFRALFRFLTS